MSNTATAAKSAAKPAAKSVVKYTKKDIREAFEKIGYTCTFKTNTYNADLVALRVSNAKGDTLMVGDSFSADLIEHNRDAFNLFIKFRGASLRDGQKIV